MSPSNTVRVMYVGEPRVAAVGLQVCLGEAGYSLVEACRSGRAALPAIAEQQPDLVIIGTMRPQERAFRVCRTIRSRCPKVTVIMTCWDLQDELLVADTAYVGASACVDACIEPADLVDVVARVLAGGLLFTRSQMDLAHCVERLTPRQRDVLRLALRECSTAEIAASLGISAHTVRNIETECRSKLGVKTTRDAALRAERRGMLV